MDVGQISMKMMFYMLDFLIKKKHIADHHEMPPFMGFVWLFMVCQSTCKSVSRMKQYVKIKCDLCFQKLTLKTSTTTKGDFLLFSSAKIFKKDPSTTRNRVDPDQTTRVV